MHRREFIPRLGTAAAWPVVTRAQQAAMPVIGYLSRQSADGSKFLIVSFLQGLKETGYVGGQNVAIEYRWADNQVDRPPALAADLARPPSTERKPRPRLNSARNCCSPFQNP